MNRLVRSAVRLVLAFSLTASFSAFATDAFKRRYTDIQADLRAMAAANPHSVSVVDLGKNDTGQMIQGLKVGDGKLHTLVVGTHHGNEFGSTEVALAFAHSVAEAPIKGQTVYIVPVLNVSGYDKRTRTELGKDPNRDYPGPCGTDGPFALRSTKALADFIAKENIITSATLHTFSEIVLYPWGFSTHDTSTEYDGLYRDLATSAAHESGYKIGNSADALYPADGCYEDYAMWKHGVWSLLFEMGRSHSPNQRAINELIRGNVPGLRRFLESAPTARAERHAFTGKCIEGKRIRRRLDE